jgi:TonB family protein
MVKPKCFEGCTPEALAAHIGEVGPACTAVIGMRIDTEGRVTATDMLRSSDDATCDRGIVQWARSTRWTPAEESGRPVIVWIAQPVGARGGETPRTNGPSPERGE